MKFSDEYGPESPLEPGFFPRIHDLPAVEDIRRLELKPTDVLVLRSQRAFNAFQAEDLKERVRTILGVENTILVLADGLTLDVLDPTLSDPDETLTP
jgi:hypothetical protein